MAEVREKTIVEKFIEGTPIDRAMVRGIRDELRMHKRLGHSIVTWRDGKVVWIPPEEIPEYPDEP